MATAGNLLWYALPLSLAVLLLFTGRFSAWLEGAAERCRAQGQLVDHYYKNASKFLKLTDAQKDADLREMVVWLGKKMLDSILIEMLLLTRFKNRKRARGERKSMRDDPEYDRLPEEAKHAFGQAMGAALLSSSYQAVIMGERYRAMLELLMESKDKEVREPKIMVHRLKSAAPTINGHNLAA